LRDLPVVSYSKYFNHLMLLTIWPAPSTVKNVSRVVSTFSVVCTETSLNFPAGFPSVYHISKLLELNSGCPFHGMLPAHFIFPYSFISFVQFRRKGEPYGCVTGQVKHALINENVNAALQQIQDLWLRG
jgi:hypothetical protein